MSTGNTPQRLIGQNACLAALKHALKNHPLVTLVGPGGCGKTTLAQTVLTQHEGPSAFLDLSVVDDSSMVPLTVARQLLADRLPRDASPTTALIQDLQGKKHLLVLDNFEQVLDARAFVKHLLETCPDLTLLVTSRAPLSVREEQVIHVPPLASSDQAEITPAVLLFLQVASHHRANYQPDPEELRTINLLCQHLDGLPLAIELAAARIGLLEPHEMLHRLKATLPLPGASRKDLPDRQRTMDSVARWTVSLLEVRHRHLLQDLSILTGSWTFDAARRSCRYDWDDATVVDSVAALADFQLIKRHATTGSEPRFVLLETVRSYMRRELQQTPEFLRGAYLRIARWMLALTQDFVGAVGTRRQSEAISRIQQENNDLYAILDWLLQSDETQLLTLLAVNLRQYWMVTGQVQEGSNVLNQLLTSHHVEKMDVPSLIRLFQGAGAVARAMRQLAEARHWYERAYHHARSINDLVLEVSSLTNLGLLATLTFDHDHAYTMFLHALPGARSLKNNQGTGIILHNLANLCTWRGLYSEAEDWALQALDIWRLEGDLHRLTATRINLGIIYSRTSEYQRAMEVFREAERQAHDMHSTAIQVTALSNLTHVLVLAGRPHEASTLLQAHRELIDAAGSPEDHAQCLHTQGLLLLDNQPQEALTPLLDALQHHLELRNHTEIQRVASSLLQAATRSGHLVLQQVIQRSLEAYNSPSEFVDPTQKLKSLLKELPAPQGSDDLPEATSNTPLMGTHGMDAALRSTAGALEVLTQREMEIVNLVAAGKSNKTIASILGISPFTVRFHMSSALSKLGLKSRVQVAALVLQAQHGP